MYWTFQGQISHVTLERQHISVEARKLICFALAIILPPEPANQHTAVKVYRSFFDRNMSKMMCLDVCCCVVSQYSPRFWCHDTASSTLNTACWYSSATWVTMSLTCRSTPPSQNPSSSTVEEAPFPSLQTRPTLHLLPAAALTQTLLRALDHPAPFSFQVRMSPVKISVLNSVYPCPQFWLALQYQIELRRNYLDFL